MELVPGFHRDDVWTPAFAGVTALVTYYEAVIIDKMLYCYSNP